MNDDLQFSRDCVELFRVEEAACCAVNNLCCLSMERRRPADLFTGGFRSVHATVGVANNLGGSYLGMVISGFMRDCDQMSFHCSSLFLLLPSDDSFQE